MASIKEIFMRTDTPTDAIALLKEDHRKVKEIFENFDKACEAENAEECRTLAEKALVELTIHAKIEEEIFYPAVRRKMEDAQDLMDEALEEHHVAKLLIRELVESGLRRERFEAKFTVLAENVKHHIQEEESEMLPKAQKVELDFEQLGGKMLERKRELMGRFSGLADLKNADKEEVSTGSGNATGRAIKGRKSARPARRAAKSRRGTGRRISEGGGRAASA